MVAIHITVPAPTFRANSVIGTDRLTQILYSYFTTSQQVNLR